jgi:hypothetical protein
VRRAHQSLVLHSAGTESSTAQGSKSGSHRLQLTRRSLRWLLLQSLACKEPERGSFVLADTRELPVEEGILFRRAFL